MSNLISQETIYTLKLSRRGIDLLTPRRPDPLAQIRVGDVMVREVVTLQATLPLGAILEYLRRHPFASFPVMDGNGLVGILGYSELREVLTSERPDQALTARDLMRTPAPVSYPDDTLSEITEKFRSAGVGRLPVVSRDDPTVLLGVISHTDLLTAYHCVVLGKPPDK